MKNTLKIMKNLRTANLGSNLVGSEKTKERNN